MNAHVSLTLPIIAPAKLSSSKSHWDLLGNYTREVIHLKVFMTGHFKWPLASLLLIRFLHPLILLFFQVLTTSLSLCCCHSTPSASVYLIRYVYQSEMCTMLEGLSRKCFENCILVSCRLTFTCKPLFFFIGADLYRHACIGLQRNEDEQQDRLLFPSFILYLSICLHYYYFKMLVNHMLGTWITFTQAHFKSLM